jgi:pimeloyl-ACP methyl ester carboxylesterase
MTRWLEEARKLAVETPDGLRLPYDPACARRSSRPSTARRSISGRCSTRWQGLPLALIRGANSDLLTAETVARMRARRPDMGFAEVPGRAHIPFLDEPEAVALIRAS